jgi:hypothetical protein
LAKPFRLFLQNYPFASARMLSRHFSVCATTAKEILVHDLGLTKFTRRWIPHTLTFKSHDDGKVQEKIDWKGFARCPHPPYSPDLSPCDFWFFGMAKEKMKDREFRTIQDILRRLTETWSDLTFEDIQSVFREWNIRRN